MPQQHYRKLTNEEIGQLIIQGCYSEDWNQIEVVDNFIPDNLRKATFSGHNRIGRFDEEIVLFGGVRMKTGITNAHIHNCTIGNNALISNVKSYIANYRIGERVVIHNLNQLAVENKTSFGNGIRIKVINELGGREIPIYDHLSAHVAYILALYRHRKKAVDVLEQFVTDYVQFISDSVGDVSTGVHIINCDSIRNVRIGPFASLEGVAKLVNGSINSSASDPVFIGQGVIMEDFIVCSGSRITDSTLISNCFVGQGCTLDKHYSAIDSVFFANCQGFHGEACSIFAGPYTVSHHKSSLLIAGLFSFMNAGSGSNQSNHLYKLGPIHQGVLERGAKTSSDSYILWPSRIGAFTLVLGRHINHSDTTDFPFSYLIEEHGESHLVPGINLQSIGTIRDSQKWPKRDRRKDTNLLDLINFNLLSPYTIQKMIKGRALLKDLLKASGEDAPFYSYQGMVIKNTSLKRGITLYEKAIWKFLGNSVITRLQKKKLTTAEDIHEVLKKDTSMGSGCSWFDIAGLICPADAIENLLVSIEKKTINSLEELNANIRSIHTNYYTYEWSWTVDILEDFYGKPVKDFLPSDITEIVHRWNKAVLEIDQLLYDDARKEFAMIKQTGFGVDGDKLVRKLDFESVRGEFETHAEVSSIRDHMAKKEALGDEIIRMMESVINGKIFINN
jgi:carbonic anhydrase/acetyltransferase-like protein (isoleucine patch superfamily)